jgi:MoaA/NifB/PqqE/SkfB family radical SAM enzyme
VTRLRLRRDVVWRIENRRLWLLDPVSRQARFYQADVAGHLDDEGNVSERMVGSALFDALQAAGLLEPVNGEDAVTADVVLPAVHARGHGPLNVTVQVTDACNMRCGHCHNLKVGTQHLDLARFRSLVTEFRALRVFNVNVSGGEPLLHPDVVELVSAVHAAGLSVTMSTNATLLTPKLAHRLAAVGLRRVQVSLDSSVPAEHDRIRGRRNAYDRMVKGLSEFRSNGITYTLVTTLTHQSAESYESSIDTAFSLGAAAHKVNLVIPQGRACRDTVPSAEQVTGWTEAFRRKRDEYDGRMRVMAETMFLTVSALSTAHSGNRARPTCPAGILTCGIDATGDVHPCSFFTGHTIGNALVDGGFTAVWHSNAWASTRRRNNPDPTGVPSPGGCAARAYGYSGTLDAVDPLA